MIFYPVVPNAIDILTYTASLFSYLSVPTHSLIYMQCQSEIECKSSDREITSCHFSGRDVLAYLEEI